jgi:hypothetical protein
MLSLTPSPQSSPIKGEEERIRAIIMNSYNFKFRFTINDLQKNHVIANEVKQSHKRQFSIFDLQTWLLSLVNVINSYLLFDLMFVLLYSY